jgi:hypothetical protein
MSGYIYKDWRAFEGTEGDDTLLKLYDNGELNSVLQKRVAPIVVVAGIAAINGAAILTKIAIEIGADTIKNLGEWTAVSNGMNCYPAITLTNSDTGARRVHKEDHCRNVGSQPGSQQVPGGDLLQQRLQCEKQLWSHGQGICQAESWNVVYRVSLPLFWEPSPEADVV